MVLPVRATAHRMIGHQFHDKESSIGHMFYFASLCGRIPTQQTIARLGGRKLETARRAMLDLAEIDRQVRRLLSIGCVTKPPVPSNLISVFDPGKRIFVKSRPIAPLRGVIQPDLRGWGIVIDTQLPNGAKRFSLFHEGFHILQRTGAVRFDGPAEYGEWLADQFAARILMPRQWVTQIAPKADVQRLCATFKVSQAAMKRRLRELGLCVPQSTAVSQVKNK